MNEESKPHPDEEAESLTLKASEGTPTPSVRNNEHDGLVGKQLGNYQIITKIGAGGMGTVFKGRHIGLNKVVALKVLSSELVASESNIQRFMREAQTAASLEHPNVVQVFDNGDQDGHYFLAMQYFEGQGLDRAIKEVGALPLDGAIMVVRQVARALAAAHKLGIIHRDIKPANILCDQDGLVKVCDFGLARNVDSGQTLSMTGQIVGTPHYMSPEQAQAKKVDERTDIYSLGATFHHLITGQHVFTGDTPLSIILKHLQENPKPVHELNPDLPPEISNVIAKMMAKNPDARCSTAEEVIQALDRFESAQKDGDPPTVVDEAPADSIITSPPAPMEADSPPTPPTMPEAPEKEALPDNRVGEYELIEQISDEDTADVWEARHTRTNQKVALRMLKRSDAHVAKAMYNLAAEGTSLDHPNIFKVHEAKSDFDSKGKLVHYMAVDLVKGRPLRETLKSRSLPFRKLIHSFKLMAEAIHYAHTKKALHGQLDPTDVIMEPDGRPVLIYFNLALRQEDDDEGATAPYSAPYKAPEQVPGTEPGVDHRTDLYRLGAMLYEAVAGSPPFARTTLGDIHRKITQMEPFPMRAKHKEADSRLEGLVRKALDKDKDLRFQTGEEFAKALDKWLTTEVQEMSALPQTTKIKQSSRKKIKKWRQRHKWKIRIVLTLLLLGGIGGGGWYGWKEFQKREKKEAFQKNYAAAKLAFKKGLWSDAIEAAERALDVKRDKELVELVRRSRKHLAQENVERGIREMVDFSYVLDAKPGETIRDLNRGLKQLIKSSRHEEYEKDAGLFSALGRGTFHTGRLDLAISRMTFARGLGADDIQIRWTMARALYLKWIAATMIGRASETKIDCSELARRIGEELEPDAIKNFKGIRRRLAMAMKQLVAGEKRRLASLCEDVVRTTREPKGTEEFLLLLAFVERDPGQRNKHIDLAMSLRPHWPIPWLVRGMFRFDFGSYDTAAPDFGVVIERLPEWPAPYVLRGICHRQNGHEKKAKSDFAKALKLGGPKWDHRALVEQLLKPGD